MPAPGSRSLRPRASDTAPVYTISDDDGSHEEESEAEAIEVQTKERSTTSGKSLRPRASLGQPDRMKEYVNPFEINKRTATKKKKTPARKSKKKKVVVKKKGGEEEEEEEVTVRNVERRALQETKIRRDTFFLEHRKLFEPLLPANNYISKLAEKRDEDVMMTAVPFRMLEKQPEHVKATLKPYQLTGLSFLVWLYRNGVSGILGDEMGLGKTLQTLSLFSYLTTYEPVPKGHRRPFLVVCPLSVVSSWAAECVKWTPHLKLLRFHGPVDERNRLKRVAETGEEGDYDLVVTSYEVFEREKVWFRRAFVWRYVVLDEGHKIKNDKTQIAMALQGLQAEYRLILTGTPLQNNLEELWALLHWLYPSVFAKNTADKFADAFNLTLGKNILDFMDHARGLLELVMIRRMKDSETVDLGLPPKTELLLYLPLTPMQRFWYKRLLTRLDKDLLKDLFSDAKVKVKDEVKAELKEEDDDGPVLLADGAEEDAKWGVTKKLMVQAVFKTESKDNKWQKLMNLLMQLRKCCDHPYLLPNAEPEEETDYSTAVATLMLASSKFIFLNKLVEELCIKQGRKVLIFSGFTKMLDLVEEFLYSKGGDGSRFKMGRLDGSTVRAKRNLAIRLFNSDPKHKVMLISVRAGGLGINLATASDVVMLDTDWNPQVDLQAQARAHRIGQKNPVTIYRLIAQGTVEEQMLGRIRKKLYLATKVTESMRDIHNENEVADREAVGADDAMPSMSTNQLLSLVRSGARTIARPEVDPTEMLSWDWETTLQKCRDYEDEIETLAKSEDAAEEERRWLSEMEKVEARVFEGKVHKKSNESNLDIAREYAREARREGMNRVVMVGNQPVLKETMGNSQWEAVRTFAGRDPSLAEPKRSRKKIVHQDWCQVCFDGGEVYTCSGCPRVYHHDCLAPHQQPPTQGVAQFYCPQHQCHECEQKTANAGGLIFRCRWCEIGYCEDCIDWDSTQLIGESLPELEMLGFGAIDQAYWIKCQHCIALHEVDHESKAICDEMQAEYEAAYTAWAGDVPELTDEIRTEETSGVNTPATPGARTPMAIKADPFGKVKLESAKVKLETRDVVVIDSDSAPERVATPVGKRARGETISTPRGGKKMKVEKR